ncbi:MAG: thiamine phosphate synthase [Lachnospiraceae bacterium]|nr:thiamine phosphate synthase [Lachnospiraceae bacterium]
MIKFDSGLYFITDSTNYSEEEFLYRVEEALKGGITLLQLREKNKSTKEYIQLAEKVHALAGRYNVPLIIDDRVDVALAINAEGVHVGAEDMPVKTARKLMGNNKIVGATAKTVPWAKDAYEQGADYLGVGAIYPTTTKVKTVLTSTDTLRDICNAVPIPVNAIGGLNPDNIDILSGIPIAGICVVSAIMKADDPKVAAEKLRLKAKALGLCKIHTL